MMHVLDLTTNGARPHKTSAKAWPFLPGDICNADLPWSEGGEMRECHPVVILSRQPRREFRRHVVQVVPMTTWKPWMLLHLHRTDVVIEKAVALAAGLDAISIAKACQTRCLDIGRLRRYRGNFPPEIMALIRAAVLCELGFCD